MSEKTSEIHLHPTPPADVGGFLVLDDGRTWMDYADWTVASGREPDAQDLRGEWESPGLRYRPAKDADGVWVWRDIEAVTDLDTTIREGIPTEIEQRLGLLGRDPNQVVLRLAAEVERLRAERDRASFQCGLCLGPMSKNPHPQAGDPKAYLEHGATWECIPCAASGRHKWSQRALKAERKAGEVEQLRAALVVANEWIHSAVETGDAVPDEFCTPAYREARRIIREALEPRP